jgi:multiple sugar transport system substrate-binding protein
MLDTFRYRGKLYGLPKDASATIMQYNLDLFAACGAAKPTADWTWNDLLAAAKKLTRDTNGDGRADQWGMNLYPWWIFVWQNGGRVLDREANRCALLEPRAVEAIEFWAALRWSHAVTPTPEAVKDLGGWRLFALGRVGMNFEMYPVVSLLRGRCDFTWDLAPMPRGPHGRATDSVGSALAVTTQSRNKQAAFEWVRWLTSQSGMRGLTAVESPSCIALAQSPAFIESPGPPKSKQVAVDAMEYAHPPVQQPRYNEILDALTPELDKASRGEISVRAALERAVPLVDRILERAAQDERRKRGAE